MLKVGITGGIGSGKSTVCQIFNALQIPIFFADEVAKEIVATNQQVQQQIIDLLGEEAFNNGIYNRAFVAQKVFQDQSLLQQLNAIIHPVVFKATADFFNQHQDKAYVLYEAAIMIESGSYKLLDKIIVVTAPENIRIQRVMQRDNVDEAAVLTRISKQMPEAEKLKYANFVIDNSGEQALIHQVLAIHHAILKLNQNL